MDALYIVNTKNNDILISKEYKNNENNLKLQIFLLELNKLTESGTEKSPYILISNSIFVYLNIKKYGIIYLAIISEDNLVTSVYGILSVIHSCLNQAFDPITIEALRDNLVEIMLMIDQFLLNGVPAITEINALSGLISPYNFRDKITEKFIGKAKDYDTRTLLNYVIETQATYENFKYPNENIKNNYEVLFDFNDYLELTCDKQFNQLNKLLHSEINVSSQLPSNIELNLLLNIPFVISDFSIDESVICKKREIWKKKNLDCYIRHGNYTLMQLVPYFTNKLTLPFKIGITSSLTNSNYNLHVQLELEPVRDLFFPIHDAKITIYFPDNFSNSNLSVNIGEFEFSNKSISNSGDKLATWNIGTFDKSIVPSLKGHLTVDRTDSQSLNCVLVFSGRIEKYSITGGSISKATITKNPKGYEIAKKGRNCTIIKNLEIVF